MKINRLYAHKHTHEHMHEVNCKLLLLFKFNVTTHLDGSRKLIGEPRLILSLCRNFYEIII